MFGGPVPESPLSILAIATVATAMFRLGLAIAPQDYPAAFRRSALMARALFCNLLAMPAIAIGVARLFDLSPGAEAGIVLMAIAPGAPMALRRSLGAGADAAFAVSLQVVLAAVTVVSMPLSMALLDEAYGTVAQVSPATLARQVFVMQWLPLAAGCVARRYLGRRALRVEPLAASIATALLVLFVSLVLADIWRPVWSAHWRVALAILVATWLALALGHAMGRPEPATCTALAIGTAARNAGLALLVTAVNRVPEEVQATVLAYLLLSALAATPYVLWRRRDFQRSGNILPTTPSRRAA